MPNSHGVAVSTESYNTTPTRALRATDKTKPDGHRTHAPPSSFLALVNPTSTKPAMSNSIHKTTFSCPRTRNAKTKTCQVYHQNNTGLAVSAGCWLKVYQIPLNTN